MRLPQELLDEIIGHLDLSKKFDRETSETLMSCALVSRALTRPSQMALFHRICAWDYFIDGLQFCDHLSALLSSSPHVADYIRTLDVGIPYNGVNLTLHILSAVTRLHTLIMRDSFDTLLPRDSPVFAFTTLRRFELRYFELQSPQELQSVLLKAVSLEELVLSDISFRNKHENTSFPAIDEKVGSDCSPRLKSLDLVRVQRGRHIVEALDISIRNLESLTLSAPWPTAFSALLQANAMSLRHIKVIGVAEGLELTPMILERGNQLSCLEFEVHNLGTLVSSSQPLLLFGDLRDLNALKTIRIGVAEAVYRDDEPEDLHPWASLDALLTHSSRCDLHIHARFGKYLQPMDFIGERFPLLAASRRLHLHTNRTAP